MKKSVLVGVLLAAAAGFALAAQPRIDIPEINKYYTDYNYVVAYSTPAERSQLARKAAGVKLGPIPNDSRLKALYEMVKGLLAAELDQDPGIIKGNRLAEGFLYAKIPVAVSRVSPGRLVVRTVRLALGNWWQDGVAGVPDRRAERFDPRESRAYSYSETDYWVRAGGKWRLSSLHFYLIGN